MLAPLPPTFSWTEPDYTPSWNQSLASGVWFLIELALDTSAEWGFGSYLMRNRELNKIGVLLARWAWEDIDLYLNILLSSPEYTAFLRIVSMQFVPAGNAFSCKQQRTQPSGTLRARKFTLSCNKKLRDRVAPGLINSVVQCYYQDSGVHPQSPCSLT